MAKIVPIDVIKGISGKYGNNSNDYFATNSSSGKIHLAKLSNPYTGPKTDKQLAQQEKFKTRQAVCTAWLNKNKPSETNGTKGTEAYQLAQRIKRSLAFSAVSQVVYKYMGEDGKVNLPLGDEQPSDEAPASGGGGGSTPTPGGGGESGGDDDQNEL